MLIGYNLGTLQIDNDIFSNALGSAGADGAVIDALPDSWVDVDGREYFTAAVPPTVDFVRSCYLDGGTLVPTSSGMLTRPTE